MLLLRPTLANLLTYVPADESGQASVLFVWEQTDPVVSQEPKQAGGDRAFSLERRSKTKWNRLVLLPGSGVCRFSLSHM